MNRKFIFKLKLKFVNLIKKKSYEFTSSYNFVGLYVMCVPVHCAIFAKVTIRDRDTQHN